MSKFKHFIAEVTARIKGDDAAALAAKNARIAESALNVQISTLEAKETQEQGKLEEAEETLKDAKFPATKISDNEAYLASIRNAQAAVDRAKETLESTQYSIEYYKKVKAEFEG